MDNAKFIEDIQNCESQLHKDFIFEEEQIVIPMTTVPNDEVVIPFRMKIQLYQVQFILK